MPIGAFIAALRRAPWWLLLAYPASWAALFTLSTTHWFLPAGLRVAALWLMPTRKWGWLALAEWLAIAAVLPHTRIDGGPIAALFGIFLPWLVYAFVVHEVKRLALGSRRDGSAYWVPLTVLAGLVGASLNALLQTGLRWLDDGSFAQPVHAFLMHALSGYSGVVALAPVIVQASEHWRTPVPLRRYVAHGAAGVPTLGLLLTFSMSPIVPREYQWFLVSIPLIALGTAFGRHAAVASLTLLAWAYILSAGLHAAAWEPEEVQRMLTVTGSAALLLGARRDAMHLQRERLSGFIDELQLKTQALRDAATRLSTQREAESRQLGLELHDEVGQDMTALATRLRLAERRVVDDAMRAELRDLQKMVKTAHDHLRSVIRHLHPIALERFGLQRALSAGPLSEIADDAGISYQCELAGPIDGLPLDVATAIYRICQESVTNAVRHGCGGSITVCLRVAFVGHGREVELAIRDLGGPIHLSSSSTGMGLQGIRDRANALGAAYRFNPAHGQPRHHLRLVLPGRGPDRHPAAAELDPHAPLHHAAPPPADSREALASWFAVARTSPPGAAGMRRPPA